MHTHAHTRGRIPQARLQTCVRGCQDTAEDTLRAQRPGGPGTEVAGLAQAQAALDACAASCGDRMGAFLDGLRTYGQPARP
jgi:hypothetical protein